MLRRRDLLLAGAGAAATLGWRGRGLAQTRAATVLPIPELIDTRERCGFSLVAAQRRHVFGPGLPVSATYGYSADFLGPVLRLYNGDTVQATVENQLETVTTTHWHGLMVPSTQDGGPHEEIRPGGFWQPRLEIAQAETTAWYHAHPHNDTGRQVYMGLAGMMIIEDGTGERLGLPRTYGLDDLPLMLQDRQFTTRGELDFTHFARERILGTRGDTLIVNGAIEPTARVPKGLVRLRLLNAANARNFHLGFDDGRAFTVIASDGGYLTAPVPMAALTISPGERFEIIVDFSDGAGAVLATTADPQVGMPGMPGMPGMGNFTNTGGGGRRKSGAGVMVRFEVDPGLPVQDTRLPDALVALAAPDPAVAIERRRVTLDMWPGMGGKTGEPGGGVGQGGRTGIPGSGPAMGMNGKRYDMHRIDFAPKLGSSEIWEVHPFLMAHPFHLHGAMFRVLTIGGAAPPAHLAGNKDTVLLGEVAELLVTFDQPATKDRPFMVHCHILDHEDAGLMGQYMTTLTGSERPDAPPDGSAPPADAVHGHDRPEPPPAATFSAPA